MTSRSEILRIVISFKIRAEAHVGHLVGVRAGVGGSGAEEEASSPPVARHEPSVRDPLTVPRWQDRLLTPLPSLGDPLSALPWGLARRCPFGGGHRNRPVPSQDHSRSALWCPADHKLYRWLCPRGGTTSTLPLTTLTRMSSGGLYPDWNNDMSSKLSSWTTSLTTPAEPGNETVSCL
jgi:hypothetical protein